MQSSRLLQNRDAPFAPEQPHVPLARGIEAQAHWTLPEDLDGRERQGAAAGEEMARARKDV